MYSIYMRYTELTNFTLHMYGTYEYYGTDLTKRMKLPTMLTNLAYYTIHAVEKYCMYMVLLT